MVLNGVIGRVERDDSRYYVDPADPETVHTSVTTVLDATQSLDMVLVPWSAKLAAEFTVDHLDTIQGNVAINRQAGIDLIKGQAKRLRDIKKDIGTYQHDVLEALILDRPVPQVPNELVDVEVDGESVDLDAISDGLLNFITDFEPVWEMAEATVANPELGYAGTLDACGYFPSIRIPGRTAKGARLVLDLKTGSRIGDNARPQIVSYRRATEVWVDHLGNKERMPEVDLCAVLHVRREFERGYKFYVIPPEDEAFYFRSFLAAFDRYKHLEEAKPKRLQVMYPPLDDGSQPLPLIEDVEALGRYRKPLVEAGLHRIDEVAEFTAGELLALKGIGKKAPDEIRAVLKTYDKTLKGEVK